MTVQELHRIKSEHCDQKNGCCLHVVCEDLDASDDSVRRCLDRADEEGCLLCTLLGEGLDAMTEPERMVFLIGREEP